MFIFSAKKKKKTRKKEQSLAEILDGEAFQTVSPTEGTGGEWKRCELQVKWHHSSSMSVTNIKHVLNVFMRMTGKAMNCQFTVLIKPPFKSSDCICSHTLWTYLLFICCRDMTEVFTGLPEQDVLLTEFFLEKFLWRHTVPEFLSDLKLVSIFSSSQCGCCCCCWNR